MGGAADVQQITSAIKAQVCNPIVISHFDKVCVLVVVLGLI
jgi:hypothetical protein